MINQIVVEFGDNLTSTFYWHDVEGSLQKLKKNIEKRFTIHPDHQIIRSRHEVLDEESFQELYGSRFAGYNILSVQIIEEDLYSGIIRKRRDDICKHIPIIEVEIPAHRTHRLSKMLSFKTKPYLSIADLKTNINKKNKLGVDTMLLGVKTNQRLILADDQLISDLLLSLDKDKSLGLNLTMRQTEATEHTYYNLLRPVKILIPFIESDLEVDYPLLENGYLGISVLKSWVEAAFEIPYAEQEVTYRDKIIEQNEMFPKHVADHVLGPLKVRIAVYSTSDEDLNSLYRKLEIKTMFPINISSFGAFNVLQYHYRRGDENQLDVFIENSLQIPKHKQRIFVDGRRISSNDIENIVNKGRTANLTGTGQIRNEQNLTNNQTSLSIKLAVQVDDTETELLEKVKQLGLSRMRSIIIKHPDPDDSTIFHEIPLSQLNGQESNFQVYKILKNLMIEKYKGISLQFFDLLHDQKHINWLGGNINDFFVEEDTLREKLVLTIIIKANRDKNMQKFCEQHHLTFLKELNIKFLTGQFSFDVLSGKVNTIRDIKNEIFKTKGIAPHLQQLYHESIELTEDGNKSTFMNKAMMSQESVTLNLLIKPAQEVKLYVNANFLKEQIEIEILESATVLDLKESISAQSGIPPSLIVVGGFIDEPDSEPIWRCSFTNNVVQVHKRVVVYVDNNGVILRRDHFIRDLDTETVDTLHKDIADTYINYGLGNVIIKNTGLKSKTLLKDVGEQEIRFEVNTSKGCSVM